MYYCKHCNYRAKQKSHYDKHLKSKKHIKLAEVSPKLAEISPKLAEISPKLAEVSPKLAEVSPKLQLDKKGIFCKYCNKEFRHKSSLSKHIKYTCKKNDDEDIRELVRLLNEQNKKLTEQNSHLAEQNTHMQKQIEKLSKKLQVGSITNNNNTTNCGNSTVNYNIKLLNYRDTDYSHLTHNDYLKCISDCNHCVKTLIQKVHINKKKPENMNVYVPSMKEKYIMVYNKNKWNLENRKEIIDNMFDQNEWTIEQFYDEYKTTYPDMVKSFEKYLENKDEDDVVNQVKEKILLELYNEKDTICNKTKT